MSRMDSGLRRNDEGLGTMKRAPTEKPTPIRTARLPLSQRWMVMVGAGCLAL